MSNERKKMTVADAVRALSLWNPAIPLCAAKYRDGTVLVLLDLPFGRSGTGVALVDDGSHQRDERSPLAKTRASFDEFARMLRAFAGAELPAYVTTALERLDEFVKANEEAEAKQETAEA